MKEFFIYSNSFAAPFCSDSDERYVNGINALDALKKYVNTYSHPAGLYAAAIYDNHKQFTNGNHLLLYKCNQVVALDEATKGRTCYTTSYVNGVFCVDDVPLKYSSGGKIIDRKNKILFNHVINDKPKTKLKSKKKSTTNSKTKKTKTTKKNK